MQRYKNDLFNASAAFFIARSASRMASMAVAKVNAITTISMGMLSMTGHALEVSMRKNKPQIASHTLRHFDV